MIDVDATKRRLISERVGLNEQYLYQCLTGRRVAPAERCASIEQASEGAVTRRDLRPADWWLIWPELVCAEHPAPVAEKQEVL